MLYQLYSKNDSRISEIEVQRRFRISRWKTNENETERIAKATMEYLEERNDGGILQNKWFEEIKE